MWLFSVLCIGLRIGAALGVGGGSYLELPILSELWTGERLVLERGFPRYRRPGRPISVSAVPLGPGIDILKSCRFIDEVSLYVA